MDDVTDTALGIAAGVGIALCGICVLATAWRQSKIRAQMKTSRSDTEISKMVPQNTDPIVVYQEPLPADQF